MNMYRIVNKSRSMCFVVGAKSFRHAALIVAEVIAENSPPGTGGVCCVEKLLPPQSDDGTGYYAPVMGRDSNDYYRITPNHVQHITRDLGW